MAAFSLTPAAKKRPVLGFSLVILVLCAACTIAPPSPPVQKQTFAHMPRLNWQAAPPAITYAPGLQNQNGSAYNPVSIVENWVQDRLPYGGRFEGGDGSESAKVTFTIMAAGITETRSQVRGILFDGEQVS